MRGGERKGKERKEREMKGVVGYREGEMRELSGRRRRGTEKE